MPPIVLTSLHKPKATCGNRWLSHSQKGNVFNMTSLQPFAYGSQEVRTILIDNEPWFVLNDLCAILELGSPHKVAARLDKDDRTLVPVTDSIGRQQSTTAVNEGGMFDVIVRSDSPIAKPFRRWVTHEVLPQIRKTGAYAAPALTGPALMAAALIEAQATITEAQTRVLELEPKANAWDAFLSSVGDYSVNEAAKILARDKNIHIGEGRLRALLEAWKWIYRQSGQPRAMQAQIDVGRMAEKPSFYFHPETGEKIAKTPQVRITPKGIDAIARRMHEVAA